jgi:type VI secretion system protein ImpC
MPQRFSIGSIELSATPGRRADGGERDVDTPYRIIVLGDFGAGSKERPRLGKPVRVDLDNLENVFAQFSARIELPWLDGSLVLTPRTIADLHPDQLFQLPCFEALRDLRTRLADANTFHAALPELHALDPAASSPRAAAASSPQKESDDDVIQRLLGRPRTTSPNPAETPAVQALLREAVAPNLAKANAAEQAAAIAALDRIISGHISNLLHQPLFQALEASWRGIDFMVRQIELDDSIELYLCDMPADRLRETALNQSLASWVAAPFVQRGGCALVLGLYSFGTNREDVQALGAIADEAQKLGTPFITAAETALIDQLRNKETSFSDEWQQLRGRPAAKLLALVTPRFLLRLPYGKSSDPIESLALEEMPVAAAGNYLWGNPALIAGVLLAQSFAQSGWEMQGDEATELSGLPQHVYREDGEARLTPCAERSLGDEEAERLAAHGLSSLVVQRSSDSIRLGLQPLGRANT